MNRETQSDSTELVWVIAPEHVAWTGTQDRATQRRHRAIGGASMDLDDGDSEGLSMEHTEPMLFVRIRTCNRADCLAQR